MQKKFVFPVSTAHGRVLALRGGDPVALPLQPSLFFHHLGRPIDIHYDIPIAKFRSHLGLCLFGALPVLLVRFIPSDDHDVSHESARPWFHLQH